LTDSRVQKQVRVQGPHTSLSPPSSHPPGDRCLCPLGAFDLVSQGTRNKMVRQKALFLCVVCIWLHLAGSEPSVTSIKPTPILSFEKNDSKPAVIPEPLINTINKYNVNSRLYSPSGESSALQTQNFRLMSLNSEANSSEGHRSPTAGWPPDNSTALTPGLLSLASYSSSSLTPADEESLARLLVAIVTKEMKGCVLVVAFDAGFKDSPVLDHLKLLPNPRQVVEVRSTVDLEGVVWESTQCRGYLFLLHHHHHTLFNFADLTNFMWDFTGRYVVAGPSKTQLTALTTTKKMLKTHNLLALVKSEREGEWLLYTNQLIWETGLAYLTTWLPHRLTTSASLFPDKLTHLRGAVLTVVTFPWDPSVIYEVDESGKVVLRYGRDIQVVTALAHALNFSIRYVEPPAGEVWGTRIGNGSSWNGLMGYLQRGEAHIGIVNMFISNINNRLEVTDFSMPYDADVTCFMASQPPPLPRWKRILYPFQMTTTEESRALHSFAYSCLYAYGLHFSEAQANLPHRRSTQLFVCFLWMYTIIIVTGYRSNLTAYLTVARQPPTVNTVRELYASGLQIAGIGHFFGSALEASSNQYLKRFQAYQLHKDLWTVVEAGTTVYLESKMYLQYVITKLFSSRGAPLMRIIKECFAPYNIALTTQRHSPLKEKLDPFIMRMVESGLVQYWFSESLMISKKNTKNQEEQETGDVRHLDETENDVTSLSVDHMQGVFFVFLLGSLISTIVFVGEVTLKRKSEGGDGE
ncbi:Ionotropic receptor 21a-like 2, partial [Homarus americanus]